jgi:hypothetical protein
MRVGLELKENKSLRVWVKGRRNERTGGRMQRNRRREVGDAYARVAGTGH